MRPDDMNKLPVVAFVGVGTMAEAMIGCALAGGWPRERILLTHRRDDRRAELKARFGGKIGEDNLAATRAADIVVLGVRPQESEALIQSLRPALRAGQTLVSIAAALTVDWLRARLPAGMTVVRITPPPTIRVKAGVALISTHGDIGLVVRDSIERLVKNACERIEWLPDVLMEPVTGMAMGLTPYVCMLLSTLIKTGIEQGIEPGFARRMVMDGMWATAWLLHRGGYTPEQILEMVATREGLTWSSLRTMEALGVPQGIRAGARAMTGRSYELRGEPVPLDYRGFKT